MWVGSGSSRWQRCRPSRACVLRVRRESFREPCCLAFQPTVGTTDQGRCRVDPGLDIWHLDRAFWAPAGPHGPTTRVPLSSRPACCGAAGLAARARALPPGPSRNAAELLLPRREHRREQVTPAGRGHMVGQGVRRWMDGCIIGVAVGSQQLMGGLRGSCARGCQHCGDNVGPRWVDSVLGRCLDSLRPGGAAIAKSPTARLEGGGC